MDDRTGHHPPDRPARPPPRPAPPPTPPRPAAPDRHPPHPRRPPPPPDRSPPPRPGRQRPHHRPHPRRSPRPLPGRRRPPGPPPAAPTPPAALRWITLGALDRLVSYDSPRPCTAPCTPKPIVYHQRPAPLPPTPAQTTRLTERLHTATAHPSRAAALAAAIATGASFQQLTTARTDGFHPADHTLTLHDRTRYTDGCAIYPIPAWAAVYLHAAARFAHLTSTPHLLAAPTDRPALLRLAETIRTRPPQPPAGRAGTRPGPVVWDWREKREALRHDPAPPHTASRS
ncbi:hypothetical protein [Streptomyces sp. JL4002]|uniref:hypothetical protein n=1 Tax=Streptomyces sp. JL4002 TaxID=3404781 RepID=UPI003B28D252